MVAKSSLSLAVDPGSRCN